MAGQKSVVGVKRIDGDMGVDLLPIGTAELRRKSDSSSARRRTSQNIAKQLAVSEKTLSRVFRVLKGTL